MALHFSNTTGFVRRNKSTRKNTLINLDSILMENHHNLTIGAIIACRLKSTRLPKKALLKIGDISSVAYCIKNTLSFKNVNTIVLATSTSIEDGELSAHTYHSDVKFFQGEPDDVMQRYVDVVNKYNIDVFVRITADMPFVSDEIFQIVLKSHLDNKADYTIGTKAAIGTNLEIINSDALRKAKSYFPNADYSEYMSFYFTNNPEYFKLTLLAHHNWFITVSNEIGKK